MWLFVSLQAKIPSGQQEQAAQKLGSSKYQGIIERIESLPGGKHLYLLSDTWVNTFVERKEGILRLTNTITSHSTGVC